MKPIVRLLRMIKPLTISIDAMGGDKGVRVSVGGAAMAFEAHPYLKFKIFGDEKRIKRALDNNHQLIKVSEIHHCDMAIAMDAKPSQALRRGRKVSSMWQAVDAVKNNQAEVAVSAGNTGALMAISRFILGTISEVDRPALAAMWPNVKSHSIVLDVGAKVGSDVSELVDNAIMGAAMSRSVFGIEKPTVGLLNIGVEEIKGVDFVRLTAQQLAKLTELPFEYRGFVEGSDIGLGVVDVVVTEGFSGNIALKTAEGTAKQISQILKKALNRSWRTRIGYLLTKPAFDEVRNVLDPNRSNGAVFLGLDGLVVKSHGGTNAMGFASALEIAISMVENGLIDNTKHDIEECHRILGLSQSSYIEKAVS